MSSLTDPMPLTQGADNVPLRRPTPPRIQRWIALLDRVERLMASPRASHPEVQERIAAALDALSNYEHGLTSAQRQRAREEVWFRDRGNEPLPSDVARAEWTRCRCRACAIASGLGRESLRPATQRQLRLVHWKQSTQSSARATVPASATSVRSADR